MRKNNNGSKPSNRARSSREKYKIRKWYADKAKKEKAGQTPAANNRPNNQSKQAAPSAVGKIYRGETKYIDREPKKQRNYVVVRDTNKGVTVAKLKSIKQLDKDGKNADKALVEINHERYGLPNRTGVDYQKFNKNLMSGKPLDLKDKDVFPEDKERATLSSHDKYRVLKHVGRIGDKNNNKK